MYFPKSTKATALGSFTVSVTTVSDRNGKERKELFSPPNSKGLIHCGRKGVAEQSTSWHGSQETDRWGVALVPISSLLLWKNTLIRSQSEEERIYLVYVCRLQSITEGIQAGTWSQAYSLFHTALPSTKKRIHSQESTEDTMEEHCLLAQLLSWLSA